MYRVAGAGVDSYQQLRIAWLRLDPSTSPRQRTRWPTLWVSHQSAASLLGFGVFLADVPEFISTRRSPGPLRGTDTNPQPRPCAQRVDRQGRFCRDLSGQDPSGPCWRWARWWSIFASDAIAAGVDPGELQAGLGRRGDVETLLEMAAKRGTL